MRRQLLGLGFVAASSLLAFNAAQALNGPSAITIDGGPLGSLSLSGGADGYGYYLSQTNSNGYLPFSNKSNGAYLANALIEVQKTTGPMQFTIEVGSNGGAVTLGTAPAQTSVTTYSTGPLYAGYVTIAPDGMPFTISAGQLGSLEGWESGVDWNNANQLTTEIFYVQNSQSRGVSGTLTEGPVAATVTFGDGYDNGVWNYIQFLASYTINSNNIASLYGGANLGTTGPNTKSYAGDSPVYANSNMLGGFYNFTVGNLNLVPEVQYQYTKARAILGMSKPASNFGAALFVDYSFANTPYSVGAWGEYWTSHSAASTATAPNNFAWFIGPNSEGIGASITPTWQYKDLFARFDAGYIYLLHHVDANGVTYGYGNNGSGQGMFTGTLEAGLLF